MRRGRKPNPQCNQCGTQKTPENTYTLKSGSLDSVCKECNIADAVHRRLRKMDPHKVAVLIEQHQHEIKLLKKYGGLSYGQTCD